MRTRKFFDRHQYSILMVTWDSRFEFPFFGVTRSSTGQLRQRLCDFLLGLLSYGGLQGAWPSPFSKSDSKRAGPSKSYLRFLINREEG